MSRRKNQANSEPEKELEKLKEEVAKELHLDDDIRERGWENLTTREAGKIGGHMVKKMINLAKREIDREDGKIDIEDKNDESGNR
ncbi:alpha/beta-type small acid-soluble spore protein [Thermosediminibacter oceani]|uniref:Small, acid-soluble spore protein, alpha/be n=1 Tax=Thermosediminibacter oceani (strain ATCC BAA-1034 / DSM 16646 / JW/IW-1228P) TaxID=555079 RepID=D9RXU4_THEOJ|nr:alpha/beta-type small acid-soluble spore protein [Thermosediminibacter oceani]ADL08168.1 small, acid-soluble spore protein, alpha/be [Thermosediminibacter oceani DSM 16646]